MSTQPSRRRQHERRPRVTQEELAEIYAHRRAVKRYDELRKDVVERLKNGAVIEPGEYALERKRMTSHRIATCDLIRILGDHEAQRILDSIPPFFYDRLKVTRRSTRPI